MEQIGGFAHLLEWLERFFSDFFEKKCNEISFLASVFIGGCSPMPREEVTGAPREVSSNCGSVWARGFGFLV